MATPDHDDQVTTLEQRIVELEEQLGAANERLKQAEVAHQRNYDTLLHGPFVIFRWTATEQPPFPVEYVSPNVVEVLGYEREAFLSGQVAFADLVAPDDLERITQEVTHYSATGIDHFDQEYRIQHKDGTMHWIYDFTAVIRDEQGKIISYYGYVLDINKRKQIEEQQLRLQEEIIAAQDANLQELSTPLLPITENAVVMPLVGSIDTQRAHHVIEGLLAGIEQHQASIAILDITGVHVVDTQVARVLIHAAQAASLLGTQVVITGMRPEVAQTLVQLGVELQGIKTMNSLRSGVSYAVQVALRRAR
ncbi:STAS domain-containing protein [Candidatus Viridilinea mediisalina]|uniref:Histidine kinase n=1 Tax=Candidatus Viridilinea mediisalina TaxID=2024553 RepID=A0A2A6RHW0_9CHLR|nr:STAS domain-containing protein [Candidatus Viridilinea mediisalina]PDW02476.1 hypothetical protein CJ255_13805 [Candidatus Viridilinea mediisalina]